MQYTKLGNTEIEVSKLCIGCMSFGKAGTMHDRTLDEKESEAVIKRALSLGINFFDGKVRQNGAAGYAHR